ncbi:MAG: pyroglutamyl-peptidase I [Pseudomonadota bacterium]
MTYALLTGFEPYGGRDDNPTTAIVAALSDTTVGNVPVKGAVLPVSAQRIEARIEALLDEVSAPPVCVLATGLAPNAACLRVERLAHNVKSFAGIDNDGERCEDQLVDANGPGARLSTFEPRAIANRLLAEGIPVQLSSSAGTYLCNMALYLLLAGLERRGWAIPCGFIHVPYSPQQVAALVRHDSLIEADTAGPPPSMSVEVMTSGIQAALEICAGAASSTA